jgi:hypothetical protein
MGHAQHRHDENLHNLGRRHLPTVVVVAASDDGR